MPELVDMLRDYEQVTRVIRAFEVGGRITSMMVMVPPDPNATLPFGGSINTADMEYPPQMIDTIKTQLMERQKKIAEELEAIGVIVPVGLNEMK